MVAAPGFLQEGGAPSILRRHLSLVYRFLYLDGQDHGLDPLLETAEVALARLDQEGGLTGILCRRAPERFFAARYPILVVTSDCSSVESSSFVHSALKARRLFLATTNFHDYETARRFTRQPWNHLPCLGDRNIPPYQPTSESFYCNDPGLLPEHLKSKVSDGDKPWFSRGVIYFPSRPDDLTLSNLFQAGIPLLCPTPDYLLRLRPEIQTWTQLHPYSDLRSLPGVQYFSSNFELERLMIGSDWQALHEQTALAAGEKRRTVRSRFSVILAAMADAAGKAGRPRYPSPRELSPAENTEIARLLSKEQNPEHWSYLAYADRDDRLALVLQSARSLFERKKACCAVVRLGELEALFPSSWDLHYQLAKAKMQLNRTSAAAWSLSRAAELVETKDQARQTFQLRLDLLVLTNDWEKYVALCEDEEKIPEGIDIEELRLVLLSLRGDYAGLFHLHRHGQISSHLGMFAAISCLAMGDYGTGWKLFDLRPMPVPPHCTLWEGQDLRGKTLFVEQEQGLGDFFMMARFFPKLGTMAAKLIVSCHCSQLRMVAGIEGVHSAVADFEGPVEQDYSIPIMSIPSRIGLELAHLPGPIPYMSTPSVHKEEWRRRLGAADRPRVGLVWTGNPKHANDHRRSMPLGKLELLWRLEEAEFFGLQLGEARSQIKQTQGKVTDLGGWICDFTDTAAILENLDLLISVDTSVVHLAGALGRPCWVLLGGGVDWRWLTAGDTTPWYPSVRLFRCGEYWSGLESVRSALVAFCNK